MEKLVSRYAADVPTATPSENRSSDLGRDEKAMSSPKGDHVKLMSAKSPSIIKIDLSD